MEKEIKLTNANSGKKEGKGGSEALERRRTPNNIINLLILESIDISTPNREPEGFPNIPALANIPMEAQPWANDNITTTMKTNLFSEIMANIINVMCLTLL